MIALLEAYQIGLFKRNQWLPNLFAGLTVGIVALPLALAFAIASGAKPEQGLYTAIVAGLIVSILGGSRFQIAGPTGAFIVILLEISTKHGMAGLQMATIMAGIILVFLGMIKIGNIIKFIPNPVIVGFTAGIAVIIWVGQWNYFLGLPPVSGDYFHQKLFHLFTILPNFHLPTTLFALLSLLLVLGSPRLIKSIPGPFIAMGVATGLQYFFQFENIATIGSVFGGIPQQLPKFELITFPFSKVLELLGPAFTIALLGGIESLLSAVISDGMTGTKHHSNQELIGQGIANIVTPLFGGFAATAGIARTAINIRQGGTSPLAGITHALFLILIILYAAPLATYIPICTLAAILFIVAWNMSDLPHFMAMLQRAPRSDVFILLITFLLTVFADLVIAVNTGVILASLLFMRRMANSVAIQKLDQTTIQQELKDYGLQRLPDEVMVYSIDGPFFFGAAKNFERTIQQIENKPKILVLRLGKVPFIDITGLQTLEEIINHLQKIGTQILICEANSLVYNKFVKAGLVEKLGAKNIVPQFHDIIKSLVETNQLDLSHAPKEAG